MHLLPRAGFDHDRRAASFCLRRRAAAALRCTGSGSATSRRRSRGRAARGARRAARDGRPGGSASCATPRDLAERLLALGLAPDDPPALTRDDAANPSRRPGQSAVEVRRVETVDEHLAGARDRLGGLARPGGRAGRAPRRSRPHGRFEAVRRPSSTLRSRTRRRARRLRPRRSSRRAAWLLLGGAVLPEARGRGVYTRARPRPLGRTRSSAARRSARRQRGPDVGADPRAARLRARTASVRLLTSTGL